MIVDALLALIEGLLVSLAGFFPQLNLTFSAGWMGDVTANLGAINYYLPIAEVFAFTIGVFMVFPALAGTSLLLWIVAFFRGGSARG